MERLRRDGAAGIPINNGQVSRRTSPGLLQRLLGTIVVFGIVVMVNWAAFGPGDFTYRSATGKDTRAPSHQSVEISERAGRARFAVFAIGLDALVAAGVALTLLPTDLRSRLSEQLEARLRALKKKPS